MQKQVIDHFCKVDPILFRAIGRIKPLRRLEKSNNYFADICEAIINQQLSDKAGRTIFSKFKKLFPNGQISAQYLMKIPDPKIRDTGPSWKKVSFMKDLATKIVKKEVELEQLAELSNEEVVVTLTKLRGIGRWTAEMFLMFSLGREDIFSFGDLGLRRAIQKLYKLKKEPTEKQMEVISKKWSPYRTYAARILWRSLD